MASNNSASLELVAGKKAAKKLQTSLRGLIAVETIKSTGALMRTKTLAKADKFTGELDRITISSPHYGFKLNYGFEGVKSNGAFMNLQPTNHLYKAIEQTNILNELADALGNIRADEVTAKISF
jgi:hypothetical protein